MPRMGPDEFRKMVGKRGMPEGLEGLPEEMPEGLPEGLPEEAGAKITEEGEWSAKVNEILVEAKSKIEEITPPEFVDKVDDEIRKVLEVETEETPKVGMEGL